MSTHVAILDAEDPAPPAPRRRLTIALFSVTILVSAALVFLVQPMFVRLVLPLLGGTASVWTTSMLFFTTALLLGYLYAHLATRVLGPKRQALLHLALIGVAVVMLPVGLPEGWRPPTEGSVFWLLAVLTVAIGLPFVLVSATSPLLQRWLAGTDHPDAADPYFLYRSSNIGSVLGLLAYPLAVEPAFGARTQTLLWSAGFGLLAVLLVPCAVVVWRHGSDAREPAERPKVPIRWRRRLMWVALAFAPASLTQGVTTFLTLDLAPVPLLWVLPLGVYLLSFILVFSRTESRGGPRGTGWLLRLGTPVFPFAALAMAALIVVSPREPLLPVGLTHLAGLFVVATYCHGRLAADRPESSRLTEFYGWIALGGALGTGFNGVVAPTFFDSLLEYPAALILACLLAVPVAQLRRVWPRLVMLAMPVVLLVVWLPFSRGSDVLYGQRNFFGVKRVVQDEDSRTLMHGTTMHGAQDLNQPKEPMTYYHRTGPLGQLVKALPDPRRAAIVGLGTGSAACLSRPGDRWTFYEIDPDVVRLARDGDLFTFLRDCRQREVVLGDGRLSLARGPDGEFALMVFDAFSSDAIPTHLMTTDAIAMYRRKLAPGGVLAFHVSNRYLELEPVLGAIARSQGLACLGREDGESVAFPLKAASHWVVLAPDRKAVAGLADWKSCEIKGEPWTDDYSNLMGTLSL